MLEFFAPFRELNTLSVALRLVIAILFGGVIGLERNRKHRPAGFRTYMLVCLGAALTMILGQYESLMLLTRWQESAATLGLRVDVARFGAQVINGVGFLGAGTIIVTSQQEVKGLTTAAGLWASACMGLAIGAGFYECILLGLGLILLCVWLLPAVEAALIERAKNINLYIEFDSLDHMGQIISSIKGLDLDIHQVDINRGKNGAHPSAILALRLRQRRGRSQVLAAISKLDCIRTIDEI